MRHLALCFALLAVLGGCQRSSDGAGQRDRSAAAEQSTSDLPPRGGESPDRRVSTPPAPRAAASPTPSPTSTEASEQGPCATDADCTLTRVTTGGCCETLCQGRAVTKSVAAAQAAKLATCTPAGSQCPVPLCRPPRSMVAPACEAGRCIERHTANEN